MQTYDSINPEGDAEIVDIDDGWRQTQSCVELVQLSEQQRRCYVMELERWLW